MRESRVRGIERKIEREKSRVNGRRLLMFLVSCFLSKIIPQKACYHYQRKQPVFMVSGNIGGEPRLAKKTVNDSYSDRGQLTKN